MKRSSSIALLALPLLATAGCPLLQANAKKPKVTVRTVDVKDVDFQGARLEAVIDVANQVPVGITIGKVTWGVSTDGNRIASGELPGSIVVPPSGTVAVNIPFAIRFEDLYRIVQKYKDQDTAPYRLEGTFEIDTPIGPVTLPVSHDGTFPVLKIPEIDLAKVEVKGLSFSGADVRIGFKVKNPNTVALGVQSFDYSVSLAGAHVADGKLPSPLELPAKGSGAFDVDVKISYLQAAAAGQALASKSNADYSVSGTLSAKTPWGAVNTPFSRSGTVKISR